MVTCRRITDRQAVLLCAILIVMCATGRLFAQTGAAGPTRDTPTLLLGINVGLTQGGLLWHVPVQPITATSNPGIQHTRDTLDLRRELTADRSYSVHARKYFTPELALDAEIGYTGLKTRDTCVLTSTTVDIVNTAACIALNRVHRHSAASTAMLSLVFRPMQRARIQPYVMLTGGVAAISDNLIRMSADLKIQDDELTYDVYTNQEKHVVRFTHEVGLGLSTNFSRGYQFHIEVRERWMPLSRVTGPTLLENLVPPHEIVAQHKASLLFGFDLVLDKSRGRRY